MASDASKSKSNSVSQHEALRKRLQEELHSHNLDEGDLDWFLRVSGNPNQSIKTPSLEAANNSKSPASLSTSEAQVSSSISKMDSSSLFQATSNSSSNGSKLTRSVTAEPRLALTTSTSSADLPHSAKLTRTSTNVALNDFSFHKKPAKVKSVDLPHSSFPTSPASSTAPTATKRKGLFKKMFGKKDSSSLTSPPSSPGPSRHGSIISNHSNVSPTNSRRPSIIPQPSASKSPDSSVASPRPSISMSPPSTASFIPNITSKHLDGFIKPKEESSNQLFDNKANDIALSDKYRDIDSQLSEYLKDIEFAEKTNDGDVSISSSVYAPSTKSSIQYDPNVIPPHPDKPRLPSALSLTPKYSSGRSLESDLSEKHRKEKQLYASATRFGGLLHRTKTNSISGPSSLDHQPLLMDSVNEDMLLDLTSRKISYVPPPPKQANKPPMKILNEIKPMKKVAFATTTFVNDPPQQIPSRNPRKGNVEVAANGEIIIHNVNPEDKLKSTGGIVVGGSGHLKLVEAAKAKAEADAEASGRRLTSPPPASHPGAATMNRDESTSSLIKNEDKARAAAKAREYSNDAELSANSSHLNGSKIKIDKPMVRRKKQMDKPVVTLKIDELYTRCCHLREILPIPATLKQIPKGSTDPLPLLQLRNPRPSMIEVLSFTDFIRVAPIVCVSLDGVSLTPEMFKMILGSLLYKRYLEKLSLRNTPINEEGWKLLCWFLSMNKALKRLDITQCPTLNVNTQRIKKSSKPPREDGRMKCNLNDRSEMNWPLLTASIIYRGGVDELVLSGCKINDLRVFKNLLTLGLNKTFKLGLAYNELTLKQCEVVAEWVSDNSEVKGLDLGFNDLSSKLKPFIEYSRSKKDNSMSLISLNNCNLIDNEETRQLFDGLSKFRNLRYFDISNNKKLFPGFIDTLALYLPFFKHLLKLQLDNNALNTNSIIKLCEAIPFVQGLTSLSILGNPLDETCAIAICRLLNNSKSLFNVEFDKDAIDQKYQERIGLLTMKNMEMALYGEKNNNNPQTAVIANDLLATIDSAQKNTTLHKAKSDGTSVDDTLSGKVFTETMIDLINQGAHADPQLVKEFTNISKVIRLSLLDTIQELTNLYVKGRLNLEGKEALIRLVGLERSITKATELITNKPIKAPANSHPLNGFGKPMEDGADITKKEDSKEELVDGGTPAEFTEEDDVSTAVTSVSSGGSGTAPNTTSTSTIAAPRFCKSEKKEWAGALLGSNNIMDIVRVLGNVRSRGMSISDIFCNSSESSSNSDSNGKTAVAQGGDDNDPAGDDHSIASFDSYEEHHGHGAHSDEDVTKAYDSVLEELVKTKSGKLRM